MNDIKQQYLKDLDKKLWAAADKLLSNVNASEYKDVVMRSLLEWKAEQSAETIVDIPQVEIDGVGELEILFLRAVYCEAKADLLRETVTVDRKKEAENSGKTAPETEEKYREFAAEAVRLICGLETVGVHLI